MNKAVRFILWIRFIFRFSLFISIIKTIYKQRSIALKMNTEYRIIIIRYDGGDASKGKTPEDDAPPLQNLDND